MTENQIKEAISANFVQTIANRIGYKVDQRRLDHGVDINVVEVAKLTAANGSTRYIDSGRSVECQMKATTENGITRGNGLIKYELEAKTYNDLIYRSNEHLPLVLILFILPTDPLSWVVCNTTSLIIEKHAYWYLPDVGSQSTNNTSSITISIPENQRMDEKTIPYLFDLVYNKKGVAS